MDPHPQPVVRVEAAARSHTGCVRRRNEDHFVFGRFGRFLEIAGSNLPPGVPAERHEEFGFCALVADGMGGREGGQEASRIALEAAYAIQIAKRDWLLRIGPEDVPEVLKRVRDHIAAIDRAVAARGASTPGLSGMRTTLTAAIVLGENLFLGHVGDSRGYLLRAGRLHRLTHDQTMAQLLADVGEIEPSEVAGHHLSHILTQSLGAGDELAVEARHLLLADGDRLLLATDGLAAVAEDAELERLLVRTPDTEAAADRLLELALDRGAPDNVTVVVGRATITRQRRSTRRASAVHSRARR